jgi:hypothetical protein
MRRQLAILASAALPLTMVAACDDDNDGNIDNPDIDPGDGTGIPGDDSLADTDLDPGAGTGLPGDDG